MYLSFVQYSYIEGEWIRSKQHFYIYRRRKLTNAYRPLSCPPKPRPAFKNRPAPYPIFSVVLQRHRQDIGRTQPAPVNAFFSKWPGLLVKCSRHVHTIFFVLLSFIVREGKCIVTVWNVSHTSLCTCLRDYKMRMRLLSGSIYIYLDGILCLSRLTFEQKLRLCLYMEKKTSTSRATAFPLITPKVDIMSKLEIHWETKYCY